MRQFDRLGEIVHGARGQCERGTSRVVVGGQHQHAQVAVGGHGMRQQFDSRHARHSQVADHEGEFATRQRFERCGPRTGHLDFVSPQFEEPAERQANGFFVINDEHSLQFIGCGGAGVCDGAQWIARRFQSRTDQPCVHA